MSQYPHQPPPPPQQPPPYQAPQQPYPTTFDYYQPAGAEDALGPARRAGTMTFVVAAMTFVGAFCCAGVGGMLPQMMQQDPQAFAAFQQQFPQLTNDMLRMVFFVLAGIVLLLAIAMTVIGVFVRRGSKTAAILGIVLSVLLALYLLLSGASSLLGGAAGPPAQALGGVCMLLVPIGALVVLCVYLFQAVRASDAAANARERYLQQYMQFAYQQQMYAMQQQQQSQPQQPPAAPSAAPQQFWRPAPPPDFSSPPPPPPPATPPTPPTPPPGDSDVPPTDR